MFRSMGIGVLVALLSFATTAQQAPSPPGPIVTPVMSKDLSDLPGKEALMLSVEYPPGARTRFTGTMPTASSTCWKARS